MVKIIMHGCCGHMGQVISDLVEKDTNAEIVAGIDVTDKGNTSYPVFTDIHECKTEADVLIDFSSAKAAGKKSGRRSRDEAFVSHGTAFTACYAAYHDSGIFIVFSFLTFSDICMVVCIRKCLKYRSCYVSARVRKCEAYNLFKSGKGVRRCR